jgi:hypothetical protein
MVYSLRAKEFSQHGSFGMVDQARPGRDRACKTPGFVLLGWPIRDAFCSRPAPLGLAIYPQDDVRSAPF